MCSRIVSRKRVRRRRKKRRRRRRRIASNLYLL
jgi:hypothetical protein